ncbi:MAG: hypothetical protein FK733_14495 [Asgard group archaeon]|nr:hypothetical protein [Asgard group archaeon]
MKFIQTGTFRENYLEENTTIKIIEQIDSMMLNKLDYLIGFLKNEKPEVVTNYVKNLIKKYQGLAIEDFWGNSSSEIKKVYSKFNNLKQYPDLQKTSLNYLIHLFQLKDAKAWETTEKEISRKALIQAWIFPSYYSLQTLSETIDRKEAVKFFKRYITNFYIEHPPPRRDKFVDLEKRFADRTTGDTTSSEWVIVHTMLEEGKYAFKNKNCPTLVDAMKELPDVELKYLVSCYGDYAKFRAFTNDSIILTMEHTIMEGYPYCSRVMHDTRVDYNLRHPPTEFWDNLEPGKEEEAKKYYKK